MKFLDTNAIILLQSKAFEEPFIISSITLNELEQIKTSRTKDEETKWAARQILRLLAENEDKYEIEVYKSHYEDEIKTLDLPLSEDSKIIICAKEAFIRRECLDIGVFVTEDLACKKLAECIGLKTEYVKNEQDNQYTGYLIIDMNDEELAHFYGTLQPDRENKYKLLTNQYLLIKHNGSIVDKFKWAGDHYQEIKYNTVESMMFGKVNPIKNDVFQICALDSLCNNQVTVMRGRAGTGKSYLALGYLMNQLEHGKIDKIIIFANTVPVRGAAKLGYYPGSRLEKLLDSQIGNMLASKFGSITEIERMSDEGTLVLLPVSDIRGLDTSGSRAGIYVTEAQNYSRDMMKLVLQRIGEDCICIVEGDDNTQLDMSEYSGNNNGLRAMSEAFRGQDIYGEITLENIYRSRIAEIAEQM